MHAVKCLELNRDHQVRFINAGGLGLQTVYFEAGIYKSATGVVYEGAIQAARLVILIFAMGCLIIPAILIPHAMLK